MRREQAHELLADRAGGAEDAYVDSSSLCIHCHSALSAYSAIRVFRVFRGKKKPAGLSVRAGGFLCF
jgi:hypothetical protein